MSEDEPQLEEYDLRGYPAVLLDPLILAHPAFTKVSAEGFRAQIHLMAVAWRTSPACTLPDVADSLAFHARCDLMAWSRLSGEVLEHWRPAGRGLIWFPPMLPAAKLAATKRDDRLSKDAARQAKLRAKEKLIELGVQLQGPDLELAVSQFQQALAARGIRGLGKGARAREAHIHICSQLGILPDGSVHDMSLEARMRGTGSFRRVREPP
ncbi:MAG: hypothetical protein AAFR79_20610 [Pseudomonadota bacterium]